LSPLWTSRNPPFLNTFTAGVFLQLSVLFVRPNLARSVSSMPLGILFLEHFLTHYFSASYRKAHTLLPFSGTLVSSPEAVPPLTLIFEDWPFLTWTRRVSPTLRGLQATCPFFIADSLPKEQGLLGEEKLRPPFSSLLRDLLVPSRLYEPLYVRVRGPLSSVQGCPAPREKFFFLTPSLLP